MDRLELYKLIGSSFGYILSFCAIVTMVVTFVHKKVRGFVRNEANSEDVDKRLDRIEDMLKAQNEEDDKFRTDVRNMLKKQGHASKQSLAFILENTYTQKKSVKQLTPLELKRITSAYSVYHDELEGNSYITELYTEMMDEWEHL